MRLSTPCSRIRSSLVETSSSFVACGKPNAAVARLDVSTAEPPTKSALRSIFILPSLVVRMNLRLRGANAQEHYNSGGMLSINQSQRFGLAVERQLSADGRGQMREQFDVPVIAESVCLNSGKECLTKSRWLQVVAQQQLRGPVRILDPAPNVVVGSESESRLCQIAIEILAFRQRVIVSPKQHCGPAAVREVAVVQDRRRHALNVLAWMQRFWAGELCEGI